MRDALSIFDQVAAFCGNEIKHEVVVDALSLVDAELFFNLTDLVEKKDSKGAVELSAQIISRGYDPVDFLEGLSEHLRNLIVAGTTKKSDLIEASEDFRRRYLETAIRFDNSDLLRLLKITSEAVQQIKYVSQPRIKLEMTLLQLVSLERSIRLGDLLQQIEELKKNLGSLKPDRNNPAPSAHQAVPSTSPSKTFRETEAAIAAGRSRPLQRLDNTLKRDYYGPNSKPANGPVNPYSNGNGSEAPRTEAPAPNQSNESSFQEITVRWEELLQAVRMERIGVWSQLINLKPLGIKNGWLMLGAPNEVIVGMTRPHKNYIQEKIQKTLGVRVAVDFTIVPTERTVDSEADDPLIKYLKDEFGAEPID